MVSDGLSASCFDCARRLAESLGQDPNHANSLPFIVSALASEEVPMTGPRRWIADTGSGHDIIGDHDVSDWLREGAESASEVVELHTANGIARVDTMIPVQVFPLKTVVMPLLLESCPPVLSVGRRCIEEGFEFRWKPYSQHPTFRHPDGTVIVMEVEGFVPTSSNRCRPVVS